MTCRVSDAGGGELEFTQVKSGEVQKDDFNTAVRNVHLGLPTAL